MWLSRRSGLVSRLLGLWSTLGVEHVILTGCKGWWREAVGHTWNGWIVWVVRVVWNAVRHLRTVWVSILAVSHRVAVIHGVGVVLSAWSDGTWADAGWWLAHGMLREGCWVDGREPDARLVDAVQFSNEVLEVDVVIGVVVEDELLEIPAMFVSISEKLKKGYAFDSPLPLGVENLHLETKMSDFLLAGTLGLSLVSLLLCQHLDLVVIREALDGLGFQIVVVVAWDTALHR